MRIKQHYNSGYVCLHAISDYTDPEDPGGGRILGQNPRICLEISIFFKPTQPLTVSVKEKGGKPHRRKPYPLPFGLRNPYRNLKPLKTLKIMPANLNDIVCS
jgi:hypothetical protein